MSNMSKEERLAYETGKAKTVWGALRTEHADKLQSMASKQEQEERAADEKRAVKDELMRMEAELDEKFLMQETDATEEFEDPELKKKKKTKKAEKAKLRQKNKQDQEKAEEERAKQDEQEAALSEAQQRAEQAIALLKEENLRYIESEKQRLQRQEDERLHKKAEQAQRRAKQESKRILFARDDAREMMNKVRETALQANRDRAERERKAEEDKRKERELARNWENDETKRLREEEDGLREKFATKDAIMTKEIQEAKEKASVLEAERQKRLTAKREQRIANEEQAAQEKGAELRRKAEEYENSQLEKDKHKNVHVEDRSSRWGSKAAQSTRASGKLDKDRSDRFKSSQSYRVPQAPASPSSLRASPKLEKRISPRSPTPKDKVSLREIAKPEKAPAPKPAPAAAPQAPAPPKTATDPGGFHSLEVLRAMSMPGLDYPNREKYIESHLFPGVFGCTKEEFDAYPKWKKTKVKRSKQLF
jgi:hypothetical protein